MLPLIITLVVAISAVWVYLDATNHRIGKVPDAGGLFNMSAEAWGIATLFLWVVAFPAYLIKRNTLKQRAKSHPVTPSRRIPRAVGLGVLGAMMVAWGYSAQTSAVPGCGASATQQLAKDILKRETGQQGMEVTFRSVRTAESGSDIRHCKAVVDIRLPNGRTVEGRTLRYASTVSDGGRHLVEIKRAP